jgi:hypothetical protein
VSLGKCHHVGHALGAFAHTYNFHHILFTSISPFILIQSGCIALKNVIALVLLAIFVAQITQFAVLFVKS